MQKDRVVQISSSLGPRIVFLLEPRAKKPLLAVFLRTNSQCDRLCGLVVSVADYKHRGLGFDSRAPIRIFLRDLGLERGPPSLVIG
jgi:hypothetical protein